jgi:hypothetical protein
MIRLIAGALLAAGAAGFILSQFQGTAELAVWEILLLLVVFVQYRRIPDRGDPLSEPLFRLPKHEARRLPRAIASTELAVIDATTGYVTPDRRLLPMLNRIAGHRLGRHGMTLASVEAASKFSPPGWALLNTEGAASADLDDLDALVSDLEKL